MEWWREAVFYEIYVRSFADSDGDGLGDLPGIRRRLPFLRELGIDALWLTPFYRSPGADHGYDVSDHVEVDPRFGSLAEFDALLAEAHRLGLRVVVDLVPNHTSSEHPWFQEALSRRDHPSRERYVFAPGRDGGPPNNWTSAFGGPAWTLDPASGEYYLHFFSPDQPDLNWHNADVQAEFERILRFWLDRDVDGFRIDVAHALFKARDLHDVDEPHPRPRFADWLTAIGQPELHPLYRRWRQLVDEYARERMFVAEIHLADHDAVASYLRPDELHLAFDFPFLFESWDADALRTTIDRTRSALAAVGASAAWVLENHDVERLPTRYGGGDEGRRKARAAALLLLALPGAAFLYAGQELGLEDVELPDVLRQDPIFFRTNGARRGRDGCRVPIPWAADPPGFGFTTGSPWLPIPESWEAVAVAGQQDDPGSMLSLYRTALAARRASDALRAGSFAWLKSPGGSLVFARTAEEEAIVCAVNVDAGRLELPAGELILVSDALVDDALPKGSAAWVRRPR